MKKEQLVVEKRKDAWKKYIGYGVTAFFVIAAAIVLVFFFVRMDDVSTFFSSARSALAPVLYGVVFAYLMNPLMRFFENCMLRFFDKHSKNITRAHKFARITSMIITIVIVLALVTFLVYLLAPELIETITNMVTELPEQAHGFLDWFNSLMNEDNTLAMVLKRIVTKITEFFEDFVETGLFSSISSGFEYIATGVWNVFGIVYNVVIGLVFSIYLLLSKEKLSAQTKKMLFAIMKKKRANWIIKTAKSCHRIFTGAITGKILDSAVVGVLCYVGMIIIDLPYAALISVIVGVTNVIPFFGPYIGTIPSALLILFVSPIQCLYFLIFIVILQQIDCNILDPRIVGGSVGLSPFWVLFACVVFGGMFGLPGLLLGVPVFACIYMIIKEMIENKLHKKGLKTGTGDYYGVDSIDGQELILTEVEISEGEAESAVTNETGINYTVTQGYMNEVNQSARKVKTRGKKKK